MKFSIKPCPTKCVHFLSFMHEMHEDMYCMHRILHVGKNIGNIYMYNEPLMIIIVLMLELVEKPTITWTQMNMLLMLMNETGNPMERG